ncbi:NB-ARC domain-containing protein [Streptomyces sp. Je 1-79]|uniref:ATP-binding protein n=1 Tax=Streptomyces sp. Je 1-79 TaxID=2943847 RepID=UPI0021A85E91|nr:BTAD domain-containing putative transcriptional regulator [Streptomyces sp. Je 1-79]MCT4357107.1 NB-ARC domain-containing protein [Streptomyces sp. Je 1-79]
MIIAYRVLGPCQAVLADGREAALGGARLRALLAALAAAGGRGVRTGELIEAIWQDDPPGDGTEALQALVGRLRRALGREAVVSLAGGYGLAAGPEDVDLYVFERLAGEGAGALAAGEADRAARLLDEALGLWRGPALADLPGRGGDPLVVRVEQRHARVRRDRLAAAVALGRAETAIAPLEALAAEHPLDEPLQALRIRALGAAGRAAEALSVYDEVRSVLADRLGADPGAELRSLHAELLAGQEPRAEPHRVPARLTSFVGRDSELHSLVAELEERRLVTLLGPGGVGKTRLALEAAERGAGRWPDGVRIAELASVRAQSDVPAAVLTALGGRETQLWGGDARDELTRLVEYCAPRRLLLLLDNGEHVVGAAAELAEQLLARCPGVTVLATSREPLGVPGEFVRPVEPLPQDKALRLLADRGAAARPSFDPADDPEACAEICRRLDGLPLAIELAAARLRLLAPRQIADRLDDRFRLLTSGARTAPPRRQTLRAVVDWSWDLLTDPERAVLRRLSVFSGGCGLGAAEAVCTPSADAPAGSARAEQGARAASVRAAASPGDALDVLGSLVDKSLVVAAPTDDGTMRYRLLETVAEYAGERLDEAGERAEVERRHLVHYRELARTADPALRGPGQDVWLRRLEREHDNVTAALRTAVDHGEEQEALCLVLSMSWFWQLRARQADARSWSAAAAALGPDPFAAPVRHDVPRAVPLADRCTDTPPPWSQEQLWEARRGCRLLVLASEGGEGATALQRPGIRARLDAIVAAYRPGLPQNCRQPGSMWFFARLMTGEFHSLDETLDALLAACRTEGFDWELAFAHLLRARLLGGRPDDAEAALARFGRIQDAWGIAESLAARGEAYERSGRLAEAAADFERAAHATAGLGARAQVPLSKARLAAVRLRIPADATERSEAERLLVEAAEEASTESSGEPVSTARLLLAQHYGNTGRTSLAREQLDRIEEEFSGETPDLFIGLTGGLRGWLDCLDGAFAEAAARLTRSVREVESLAYLVAPYLVVGQFATAAWAKAGLGVSTAAEDGARLLGAYDAHGAGLGGGGFRPLTEQTESSVRQRAERALRAVLDPETYALLYAEGGGLSVKEAAALV